MGQWLISDGKAGIPLTVMRKESYIFHLLVFLKNSTKNGLSVLLSQQPLGHIVT